MTLGRLSRGTLPGPSMLSLSAAMLPLLSTTSWLHCLWSSPWPLYLEQQAATAITIINAVTVAVMTTTLIAAVIELELTENTVLL